MPVRYSLLFSYASTPNVGTPAATRTGGWSESYWLADDAPNPTAVAALRSARRLLLPSSCVIDGYRQQLFTLVNGVYSPGGASTVLGALVGNQSYTADVPQMALQLNASSNIYTNTRKFSIRGIPDVCVAGGEANFSAGYKGLLTSFFNAISSNVFGYPGRDLTQPVQGIAGVAGNVLTLDGAAAFGVNDWAELIKCRTLEGVPVTGKFKVTAVAGATVTLLDFPNISGLVPTSKITRLVQRFNPMQTIDYSRIVVRKIGRPFVQYRGRRSKRRLLK
jgi:hypothetical protein